MVRYPRGAGTGRPANRHENRRNGGLNVRWTVHGHRDVYTSEWVRVSLDDVEIRGGPRFEHHVVHFPRASVTAVVTDDDGSWVLLLWRHRFITDSWGWEVPAGWADPGEDPAGAVMREIEEETGYRPALVRPMTGYNALSGISLDDSRAGRPWLLLVRGRGLAVVSGS